MPLFTRKKRVAASDAVDPLASVAVTVEGVADLPVMDNHVGGKCDPFVTLTLGETTLRTKWKARTLSASWHQRFELMLLAPTAELVVEVWDRDSVVNRVATATFAASNERVGSITLPISVIADLDGGEQTHALVPCGMRSPASDDPTAHRTSCGGRRRRLHTFRWLLSGR